jgi:hypothetical protein
MLTVSRRTVTALAASLGLYALLAVSMSAPARNLDKRKIKLETAFCARSHLMADP